MATVYYVTPEGLAYYHGTKVEPRLTTLEGYFDENGVAKNALTLEGHAASYFATADALESLSKGMTWGQSVADAAALKAVASPRDTETRALLDTNAIYQFNSESTEAESAPNVYKPDDGTAGAWIMLSHMTYNAATEAADGLMTAADKKKLDALPTSSNLTTQLEAKADKTALDTLQTTVDGMAKIKSIGTNLELTSAGVLNNTYTLPAATATSLGGIKVGSGLEVSSGTVNVVSAPKDGAGNVIADTYATKSSLATVATSGKYSDLSGTPDIQAATDAMIDAAFNA